MKKKILVACLCVALAVLTIAGTTLAYLTSRDEVVNTFTVGNVSITLDEAKVNNYGEPVNGNNEKVELANAPRVKANSYKLIPGHTYTKDPTVTVKAPSEESYVRMLVTVDFDKQLTETQLATELDNIFTGYSTDWVRSAKQIETGNGKTVITYEYRYNRTVSANTADNKLPALFTGIAIPGTWTGDDLTALGNININIVAQAIQADGFDTPEAAWAAFKG